MMRLLLLPSLAIYAAAAPTINWVSSPAPHGALVMVNGGGFGTSPNVKLTDSAGKATTVKVLDRTPSGIKFQLPADSAAKGGGGDGGDFAAYDVAVCAGGSCSNVLPLNTPDTWWWQGDGGNFSSPGGWLRVFGRCVAEVPSRAMQAADAERRAAVDDAMAVGDYDAARAAIERLASHAQQQAAGGFTAPSATLRLTPVHGGGVPILINSVAGNTTTYDALFAIPDTLAAGEYTAAISSGLKTPSTGSGFHKMSMFLSPAVPQLNTVTIHAEEQWPNKVFTVDCGTATNVFERPCGWVGKRSSVQVDAALAKARAAGGGVVYFPRGQYYVDGPLVVPDNVRLVGEGESLVSIVFREDNPDTAPQPGYIHSDLNATRWAVTDMSIYITHHYYSVFYVYPKCADWTLQRVRVRAVAWAMLGDPCPHQTGRGNRLANFSRGQVGEVVRYCRLANIVIISMHLRAKNNCEF